MKNARLSELFGGAQRFALLRALYVDPSRKMTATALAKEARADPGNVNRWLQRWATVGLVSREQDGRNIFYQAVSDVGLAGLTDISRRSEEILRDIEDALPAEVEIAAIFGSVARGEECATSDVDVLVIGGNDVSSTRVNACLMSVARTHGREINATVLSRREFSKLLKEGDDFALELSTQTLIPIRGDFDGLRNSEFSRGNS